MMRKNKLDYTELNQAIVIGKKVLHIMYVVALIGSLYIFIVVGKETGLFKILLTILKIISPLFIGMLIAWILNPLVTWFQKQGLKRILATLLVYFVIFGSSTLLLMTLIPTFYSQIVELTTSFQSTLDSIKSWADSLFENLNKINGINAMEIKESIFDEITILFSKYVESIPEIAIAAVSSVISGLGTFLVSIVMAFFFLVGFENMGSLVGFLPKKTQDTTKELLIEVDVASRSFLVGSIIDCIFIFIISSIGMYFVGLKAPLMFGLFCGITNIIPYIGPYIGGAPAVLVAFTQSTTTGFLTLLVIGVIQMLEGNILQPMILSKTTKLHPVSIMLGLLVFGYYFGIAGMILSTPLMAAVKAIVLYFDKKYDILNFN